MYGPVAAEPVSDENNLRPVPMLWHLRTTLILPFYTDQPGEHATGTLFFASEPCVLTFSRLLRVETLGLGLWADRVRVSICMVCRAGNKEYLASLLAHAN